MAKRSSRYDEQSLRSAFVFIVDECLGNKVHAALVAAGTTALRIVDVFGAGTLDQSWLPVVGERGWLLITKDRNIRHNKVERDALVRSGVMAFFIGVKNPGADEAAEAVTCNVARMLHFAARKAPPFVVLLKKGSIEELPIAGELAGRRGGLRR
jgi:hypothetical protein